MSGWLDLVEGLTAEQRVEAAQNSDPAGWLISSEAATAREVLRAGSLFYRVPSIDLSRYEPDPVTLHLLTEEQSRRFKAMPLFRHHDQLYVAVAEPQNLQVLDFVARLTGMSVEPVLALAKDIDASLTRWLLTEEQSGVTLQAIAAAQSDLPGEIEQSELIEDREAPTIRMADHIFTQAIRLGASDVHVEPGTDRVTLRYRIDGWLREFPGPPKSMFNALVSRIKIAAGMDIAERRMPQDGRSSLVVDGKKYDMRVSVIPNINGEGVVVRILNPYAIQLDLSAMGFEEALLKRYERLLGLPHGIILVTGPTGSGKSTTLYATLRKISDVRRKIITLEDPVEYQLPGLTQIQVNADIGYTFAEGLKAILRHDPDTVLVGEIRDFESAQIAIRAALTGHQMFSTLHTNNAPQAVTRLMDMGIPLYQIMAALNGVLAQRLLRRLCARCRQLDTPDPDLLQRLGIEPAAAAGKVYRAHGCAECHDLGYRGRVAVYEFLELTPSIRRMTPEQAQPEQIREKARSEGAFFGILESASQKVLQGLTSLDEAFSLGVD